MKGYDRAMNIVLYIIMFVAALAVLVKASDYFVDGAEKIGLFLGMSPMIVGVLIIGVGTSLPELVTSLSAVFKGTSEVVVNNVIGSNITNILLVLGLSAVVAGDFRIRYNLLKIDLPFLLGATLFVGLMIRDGFFSFGEAVLLCATLIVYIIITLKQPNNRDIDEAGKEKREKPKLRYWLMLILSPIGIFYGAKFTIDAVVELAKLTPLSTSIISASAIALGTSLPEVLVSIQAVRKGETEMAVGNIIGSNLFNLLAVMGIPGLLTRLAIPEISLSYTLPVLLVSTGLYILIVVDKLINRLEGVLLLIIYIYYLGSLYGLI